jgi:hypothetical protein
MNAMRAVARSRRECTNAPFYNTTAAVMSCIVFLPAVSGARVSLPVD